MDLMVYRPSPAALRGLFLSCEELFHEQTEEQE